MSKLYLTKESYMDEKKQTNKTKTKTKQAKLSKIPRFLELSLCAKFHLSRFCLSWISSQDIGDENQSNKTNPKIKQSKL